MLNDKYRQAKLDFVSNLNGSNLNDVLVIISLFPMIHFISIMLKIILLFSFYYTATKAKRSNLPSVSFWYKQLRQINNEVYIYIYIYLFNAY